VKPRDELHLALPFYRKMVLLARPLAQRTSQPAVKRLTPILRDAAFISQEPRALVVPDAASFGYREGAQN